MIRSGLRHHGWPAGDALQIYHGVFLDLLNDLPGQLDAGKLDAAKPITVEALIKAGVVNRARDGVKILGKGEFKAKAEFEVYRASKSAVEAIEKAGGSVKTLAPAPVPAAAE